MSVGWQVVGAIGTALLAFFGALVGHFLTRKGAQELDTWRRREETMRMLRWAAELAVSGDDASVGLGVITLRELQGTPDLLQPLDEGLVRAALRAATKVQSGPPAESSEGPRPFTTLKAGWRARRRGLCHDGSA